MLVLAAIMHVFINFLTFSISTCASNVKCSYLNLVQATSVYISRNVVIRLTIFKVSQLLQMTFIVHAKFGRICVDCNDDKVCDAPIAALR